MALINARTPGFPQLLKYTLLITPWFLSALILSAQAVRPTSLASAHADEFVIAENVVLAGDPETAAKAFSPDEKSLAYTICGGGYRPGPCQLVIVALPVAPNNIRTIDLDLRVGIVAWSPDSTRIFMVGQDGGHILDVGTGKITPLGSTGTFGRTSSGVTVWADKSTLYFFADNYKEQFSQRFDLETLSLVALGGNVAATEAEILKTPIDHPFVTLGRWSDWLGPIKVSNRDGSFTRILAELGVGSQARAGVKFSRSAQYALVDDHSTYPKVLRLITMGTRPRPKLGLAATVVPLPNPVNPADLDQIRGYLAKGAAVYADAFRPRVNPLNQRVIGGEGLSYGRVRLTSLNADGALEARFVFENGGSPATGDVLLNFWTPGHNPSGVRATEPEWGPGSAKFGSVSAIVGSLADLPASPITHGGVVK